MGRLKVGSLCDYNGAVAIITSLWKKTKRRADCSVRLITSPDKDPVGTWYVGTWYVDDYNHLVASRKDLKSISKKDLPLYMHKPWLSDEFHKLLKGE
jgi:hypothetical protein